MDNPFAPTAKSRKSSPPAKNTFQKELDEKMRERHKKGLSTDVSPKFSDDDSDEDGISDDELLADFNATMKSPKDKRNSGDPLMMTMKKPWQLPSKRAVSPPQRKLGTLGEEYDSDESDEDYKSKSKPSFLKKQASNDKDLPSKSRPKSPSIHGRQRLTPTKDEKFEDDARPVPTPRQRHPQKEDVDDVDGRYPMSKNMDPDLRRTPTSGKQTPTSSKSPTSDRKKSIDSGEQKSSSGRKTPNDDRLTPTESSQYSRGRKSSADSGKQSPYNERKSPTDSHKTRSSLFDDEFSSDRRKSSATDKNLFDYERKTPVNDKNSPRYDRKTPTNDRKSPDDRITPVHEKKSDPYDQKLPTNERKSSMSKSKSSVDERKSPGIERKTPEDRTPNLQRKSSVLDILSETVSSSKMGHKKNSDSDDDHFRQITEKRSSSNVDRKSPLVEKLRSEHHMDDKSDGESSICAEILQEPMKTKETGETKKENDPKNKSMKKHQRSEKQSMDDVINDVINAQDSKSMRYIEQAKADPESKTGSKKDASSEEIKKPKPRYITTTLKSPKSPGSTSDLSGQTFDSTTDIRQAVYEVWKIQAMERMKKDKLEKIRKEKELEDKKKKEKEEKIMEAKSSYEAWTNNKQESFHKKISKKKEEEEKIKKEEEKKQEKKRDAELMFKTWKESKDVELKQKYKKKIQKEKTVEQRKKEEEEEKKRDALKAFKSWSEEKEKILKSEHKEKREKMKQETEEEKKKREERERLALEEYENWVEKKKSNAEIKLSITTIESISRIERVQSSRRRTNDEDDRRPWRPNSLTTQVYYP